MTNARNNSAAFEPTHALTAAVPLMLDIRFLNAVLAVAVIGFFAGYLVLNNRAAEKGFAVRSLERHITDLQVASQKLNLSVVSDESMDSLLGKTARLGLIPVSTVDYVNGGSGVVAIK